MSYDEILAARVGNLLARRKNVKGKKMFGGMGFLLNGNLLIGVRKDSLLVRLGPDEAGKALREPYVRTFDIKGRGSMKSWAVVGKEGLEGDDLLKEWIERATKFVKKLPVK